MKLIIKITFLLLLQSFLLQFSYAQTIDYSNCPACTSQDLQLLTETETNYLGVKGNNPKAPSTYGLVGTNKFNGTWGYGGVFDTFNGDNWLPIRREKQNFCGKFEEFGISRYGDENDWNIHLIPNPGFESFIQDAIPYKRANWHGASDDWSTASNGQYTIEAEITPDSTRYGNPWFPNSKNTLLIGKSICAYGPFVREESHGNRPEIHPSEIIWWKDTDEKTIVLMLNDDSNRFNDNSRAVPPYNFNDDYTMRNVTDPNWVAWTLERHQEEEISIPFRVNVANEATYLSVQALDAFNFSTGSIDNDPAPGSKSTITYRGNSILTVEEANTIDPSISVSFKNVCFNQSTGTIQGYVVLTTYIGNGDGKEGFVALQIEKKKLGANDRKAIVVGDLLGTWTTHGLYDDRFTTSDIVSSDQFGRGIVDGMLDFNGNGKTDLFVRATTTDWMTLYDGRGQWQVLNSSSSPLSDLRFGDVNGDGKTDILRNNDGKLQVAYGGTQSWMVLNGDIGSGYIQIADFNGDRKSDIVRMQILPPLQIGAPYRGTLKILWAGKGEWKTLQGGFVFTAVDDYYKNFRFGDFNADGVSDLFRYYQGKFGVYWSGTGYIKDLQRPNYTLASLDSLMFVKNLTAPKKTDIIYVNPQTRQWTYNYGGLPGSTPMTVKYNDPLTVRFGDLNTNTASEPFTIDFVKIRQRPEEAVLTAAQTAVMQSVVETEYKPGSLRRAATSNELLVDFVLQRFTGNDSRLNVFSADSVTESLRSRRLNYTPLNLADRLRGGVTSVGLIQNIPIGRKENKIVITNRDFRARAVNYEIPAYTIGAMTATGNETLGGGGSWNNWNRFITTALPAEYRAITGAAPPSVETVKTIEFELFPFYSTVEEDKPSIAETTGYIKELNQITYGGSSARMTELFGSSAPFNISWSFELFDATTGANVPVDNSSVRISKGKFANSKIMFTFPANSANLLQLKAKAQVTDSLGNRLERTVPFEFWNQRLRFGNPAQIENWLNTVRPAGGRNFPYLTTRAKYFAEDNLLKPNELLELFVK